MVTKLILLVAGAGLVVAAMPASGHHAFAAEFDATKPIKLKGPVAKIKKPNGSVERWMIEGGPPNALYRRGFTRDSLPIGVEILVEGFRAKDGSLKGNGRDLTFADGRRLFVGSSGTGAPRDNRDGTER